MNYGVILAAGLLAVGAAPANAKPGPARTAERCSNWIGWDADNQRDICGPPIRPLTNADIQAFQARWRGALIRAAQAEYRFGCGGGSRTDWMGAQDYVDQGMRTDPLFRRLSTRQQHVMSDWRVSVRMQEMGRQRRLAGRMCPR